MEIPTVVLVTDETFEAEVIRSPLPVVVDFYADWCAPCRSADPVLEELSSSLAGRVKFAKVNVDDSDAVTRSVRHPLDSHLCLRRAGPREGPADRGRRRRAGVPLDAQALLRVRVARSPSAGPAVASGGRSASR